MHTNIHGAGQAVAKVPTDEDSRVRQPQKPRFDLDLLRGIQAAPNETSGPRLGATEPGAAGWGQQGSPQAARAMTTQTRHEMPSDV